MNKYFTNSKIFFVIVLLWYSAQVSFAQTTESIPVTFGAQFFGNYSYTVNGIDGKDFSKFDVDRMYLTMKSKLSDNWKLQFTSDVYRNTSSGTYYSGLSLRVKFAFLDFTPWSSLSIKAGMIPGPWNGVVETQWKYRGVVATANDKYNYIQTADLGLSATYSLPEKYGEIAGYIYNGDGYTSPETNQFKDLVLRATINPFPTNSILKNLMLGGYTYIGKSTTAGLKKQRFGGLVGYSYSVLLVGAEYDSKTDVATATSPEVKGNVLSLFSEIKMPVAELESKLSLVLRYDSSDPNLDKDNDKTHYFVAGLAWKATDKVTMVLDRQVLTTDTPTLKTSSGSLTDKDEKWVINAIVSF